MTSLHQNLASQAPINNKNQPLWLPSKTIRSHYVYKKLHMYEFKLFHSVGLKAHLLLLSPAFLADMPKPVLKGNHLLRSILYRCVQRISFQTMTSGSGFQQVNIEGVEL